MKALKYQRWSILWAAFILVLCNLDLSSVGPKQGFFFVGFDKLVHLGLFYTLTILIFRGRINQYRCRDFSLWVILKILLICALLGGTVELLQWGIFTWRSAEWWDFFCDLTGSLMGIAAYVVLCNDKVSCI